MGRGGGSTRLGIIPKKNQFFSAPLYWGCRGRIRATRNSKHSYISREVMS